MAPSENLVFEIGLSGTYWNKLPDFSIQIDDVEYAFGTAMDIVNNHKFSVVLETDKEYKLQIRLLNKADSDTIVVNEHIEKDMLLNIEYIKIDDIDIGELKWTASEFIPDNKERFPILKNCINLGWNGSYTLKFSTPFYLWLLERM